MTHSDSLLSAGNDPQVDVTVSSIKNTSCGGRGSDESWAFQVFASGHNSVCYTTVCMKVLFLLRP